VGREAGVRRIVREAEAQAEGGGGPDQRRAAHRHHLDGLYGASERLQGTPHNFMRQQGLVEHLDGAAAGQRLDGVPVNAFDFHKAISSREVKLGWEWVGTPRLPGRRARAVCIPAARAASSSPTTSLRNRTLRGSTPAAVAIAA